MIPLRPTLRSRTAAVPRLRAAPSGPPGRQPELRPRPGVPSPFRPARRVLASAFAAALGLGVAVLPASPAQASGGVVSRGVTIPDFYTPPTRLPAANGALVGTEPLPLALSLPGLHGPLPGRATRLMYKSTDSDGRPVAVTGAYIEPSAAWKGAGPRPLVALAPGTLGQGDQCAASLALEHPLTVNSETITVGYEDVSVYRLLAAGVAVVVTDYAGLGATDRLHTYVNRVDEGHALLDAARAAHALPGTSLTKSSPLGLYGYSQGGGASAAAAELQSSYAPELTLAGTYVGAPPADLTEVIKGIDGSALAGALAWSVNGAVQSDPSLQKIVDAHLNSTGKAALADASTMCVGDAIFSYGFTKSTKWTKDGQSLSSLVAAEPEIRRFLDAQRIGRARPSGAVRLATGVEDDIVPHAQARRLASDWCSLGGDVTYVPVRLPNLGDKLLTNHMVPLLTDQGDAISWLTDRLRGESAGSTCSSLPGQP